MNRPLIRLAPERGQTMVSLALMLSGVMALLGFVFELGGGHVYLLRRQAQNAADAAVFAALNEMAAGDSTLVHYRIQQYGVGMDGIGNGATSISAQYWPSRIEVTPGHAPRDGDSCVQVTAHKAFSIGGFATLGWGLLDATATSTGCTGQVNRPTVPLWPFAIYASNFKQGTTYEFVADGEPASGQFAWLNYHSATAIQSFGRQLQQGYAGSFQTSACADGAQAEMAALALATCVKGATMGKAVDVAALATQLGNGLIIPLYDSVQINGAERYYRVSGFAAFRLTGICLQSDGLGDCSGTSGKTIKGEFVSVVVPGELCRQDCGPDYGLRTIKLIE